MILGSKPAPHSSAGTSPVSARSAGAQDKLSTRKQWEKSAQGKDGLRAPSDGDRGRATCPTLASKVGVEGAS